MHDPCAELGQLQHFLIADLLQLAGLRDQARISSVDALDVGVDVATLGTQRAGEGHGRGIGAATAERGHVLLVGDALETGDDDHFAVAQLGRDAIGVNVSNSRPGKDARGADAGLGAGKRDRWLLEVVQRHRHERGADRLAGR